MPIWTPDEAVFDQELVIDENFYDQYADCVGPLDEEQRDAVCTSVEIPEGEPPQRNVDLLDYVKHLIPDWRRQHQFRGTCVGQGFKLGVDVVMAVNHITGNDQWLGRCAVAPIYAGSRVEIANKPGRWDGSYGWAAARWLRDYGVVTLAELDLADDSRREDEAIAVNWAAKSSGVPPEFEQLAAQRPITQYVNVKTTREMAWLVEMGHPTVQCSNLIPRGTTDANGMSRVRRSGGHCTALGLGIRYRDGRREWPYDNSWGDSWGNGGRVWLTDEDAQAILRQGDSYALIGQSGMETLPETF